MMSTALEHAHNGGGEKRKEKGERTKGKGLLTKPENPNIYMLKNKTWGRRWCELIKVSN